MTNEFWRMFGSHSSGRYVYVGIHPDFATADQALKEALPEMHTGVKVFVAGQEVPASLPSNANRQSSLWGAPRSWTWWRRFWPIAMGTIPY